MRYPRQQPDVLPPEGDTRQLAAAPRPHPSAPAPLGPDGPPRLRGVLQPDPRLVFVGINPSTYSADHGHHFARPGNAFWRLMREAGMIPPDWGPQQDGRLPELAMGVTNVVERATGSARAITPAEAATGGKRLLAEMEACRARAVCFVGATAYRWATGRQPVGWGRQPLPYAGADCFVMPSTSGRANRWQHQRREVMQELRRYLADSS